MKASVTSAGGHEVVLQAMVNHPAHVDIQLHGCKLLRNLVRSCDASAAMDAANAAIKNHGGNEEVLEAATSLVGALLDQIGKQQKQDDDRKSSGG